MAPKSAAKNQRTSKTALSGVRPDALARHTGKKAAVSQTAARPAVKHGTYPLQIMKKFSFYMAFLYNVVDKGFFPMAFPFPFIR